MSSIVGGEVGRGRWRRSWWLGAVLTAGLAWAGPAQTKPFVYVANPDANPSSGTVSQYDAAGGPLSPLAPVAVMAGSSPHAVAVSPDGRSVYVTNSALLQGAVSQFDVGATGALTPKTPATVAAGFGTGSDPVGIAVSSDGKSVYVTGETGPVLTSVVFQYDVGVGGALTPKAAPTVATGSDPIGVAVSPDGKSVYVTNGADSTVSQYDVGPGGALIPKAPAAVPTGSGPFNIPVGVVVSPDGKSVYVANESDRTLSQFDVGTGGTLTPKIPATVATLGAPQDVVISPDGRSLYVTNDVAAGAVSQYDIGPGGTLSPKSPAAVLGPIASGIAISPDGNSVYVTDSNASAVFQYDVGVGGALTPKTPATVAAGNGAEGIAVSRPPPVPTSKAQCKNARWESFGAFKNQGQCVSFIATHSKN